MAVVLKLPVAFIMDRQNFICMEEQLQVIPQIVHGLVMVMAAEYMSAGQQSFS